MKVEWFGAAFLRVTPTDGPACLVDPWMFGTAFHGGWIREPPAARYVPRDFPEQTIFLSHIHSDHTHVPSLMELHEDRIRDVYCPHLHVPVRLEWPNARTMIDPVRLGSMKVIPIREDSGELDGGFVFVEGNEAIVNMVDIPMYSARNTIDWLQERQFRVRELWAQYAPSSPYPQCYHGVPRALRLADHQRDLFIRRLANVAKDIGAERVFPFAGGWSYRGDMAEANPLRAVMDPVDASRELLIRGVNAYAPKLQEFAGLTIETDDYPEPEWYSEPDKDFPTPDADRWALDTGCQLIVYTQNQLHVRHGVDTLVMHFDRHALHRMLLGELNFDNLTLGGAVTFERRGPHNAYLFRAVNRLKGKLP